MFFPILFQKSVSLAFPKPLNTNMAPKKIRLLGDDNKGLLWLPQQQRLDILNAVR